jgi:Zn-dependent protease with chaperone function
VTVTAVHYDGQSSERRQVSIEGEAGGIHVVGEGINVRCTLKDVRISSRVGDSARLFYLPDGSQCETTDNEGVDRMLAQFAPARWFSLHRLERSVTYALVALALTGFVAWGIVVHGIPALAKEVALQLPVSTERHVGSDALRALDETLFAPSALPPEQQARLRQLLSAMAGQAPDFRLELRAGRRLGANALALPSGIIVLTDELVKIAVDDEELIAVLAHEIGHIRHRHLLRLVLQNSAAVVFIAVALGDLSSLTSLAAAAPTLLLQMKYSREFEVEADDFALEFLAARGIRGEKFAALLARIEAMRGSGSGAADYLSTHPDIRKRIDRARQTR